MRDSNISERRAEYRERRGEDEGLCEEGRDDEWGERVEMQAGEWTVSAHCFKAQEHGDTVCHHSPVDIL
jgi:hypothetical protein